MREVPLYTLTLNATGRKPTCHQPSKRDQNLALAVGFQTFLYAIRSELAPKNLHPKSYRGTSPIRKHPPPLDPPRTLGIGLP